MARSGLPETTGCAPPCMNRLLCGLPDEVGARLAPHLHPTKLRLGDVLYAPGDRLSFAYFPLTAVVSLHCVLSCGAGAEVAAVGCEGLVGMALYLGGESTTSWAAVQVAGTSMRMDASLLKDEFARPGAIRQRLMVYTLAMMLQVTQTAVCNRHHSIPQQLCRWLLQMLDRVPDGELVVTQEQIAGSLGVRRESVTAAASLLQINGAISYRRGHIKVTDRAVLLRGACECYSAGRIEIERLAKCADRADHSRSWPGVHARSD